MLHNLVETQLNEEQRTHPALPAHSDRYSRQERFTPIGMEGQQQLKQSRVLIIGAGALGSATAEMLVRAGVGRVTIVDRDYVEWSNLQRQQLYTESDAQDRLPKAIAAEQRLKAINSEVEVIGIVGDVTLYELNEWGAEHDLFMDATDNFETRMLLNDYALKHGVPWIYGACVGSYGMTMMIEPGVTPCLRCVMESVPVGGATCDTAGIIPPAVQMVVAYQTAEALKWLTGNHDALRRKLVSFDLWTNQYTSIDVRSAKRDDCPSCGTNATYPQLEGMNQRRTEVLCGRDTVQIRPARPVPMDLAALAERMQAVHGMTVHSNAYLVSIQADEQHRLVVFKDGRVLVHGTKEPVVARTLVDRYIG
ncbi:ThiF family adenylyltransferase [Paenibacillus assamensis]|uniref:ThiF family adenylyltransferase n=1 Tax=Paenibacillus assamensis TaxID=311244 RepID=UPI000402B31B|nr:ThiF family adenylyltransferase [Paenibacillus assamensis]